MGKFLRRLFFALLIIVGLALLAAVLLVSVFEGQLTKQVVKSINNNLTTEFAIQDMDVTVVRSFPNAAINLRGIKVKDAFDDVLLKADNLSFRFGLFSLLGSNIEVKSVVVERGGLRVHYDKNARANYDIFVATEETDTESSDFAILLQEASLQDMALLYQDEATEQTAAIFVEDAFFSGELSSTRFNLTSQADLQSQFVELERDTFLVDKDIRYDAVIGVDMEAGNYKFERVNVSLEGNSFDMDGSIKTAEKHTDFDILVKNESGDLAGVLQMLPKSYASMLGDFSSRGNFDFEAFVNGRQSKTQSPSVEVKFGLEDGRISSPRLGNPLKDVRLVAEYKSGLKSSLDIQELKGYFNNQPIELELHADGLENPDIDFKLDGTLPLKAIYGLADDPSIKNGSGEVLFKNVRINGKYSDMQSPSRIGRVKASGVVQVDDAGLKINNDFIYFNEGDLEIKGNSFNVRDLKIEGAGSEIFLDGYLVNLLPVMLADSLNSKNAFLQFDAQLKAKSMDLDRLIELTANPVEEYEVGEVTYDSIRVAEAQQREQFTNFLDGRFQAEIDAYNYNRVEGENFIGNLEFRRNELRIEGKTEAMDGKFDLNGTLFFEQQPRLKARLITDDVDVYEFFYQGENFGQDYLTDANVKGKMDGKIAIYAFWDENMNFDYDRFKVLAELGLTDGELLDFELFKYFSAYIKLKDLEHVKFTNLVNWFEIKHQRIYVPAMFIQSNALNLTLAGEYTFDYNFDFNLKINAGQVLANRLKRHNRDMEPQPAKRNGWFNLYCKTFGNVDDYDYKLSKREVKAAFAQSERLKNQIKEKIQIEFGSVASVEEPKAWQDVTEYGDENDVRLEFIDGF